MPRYLVALDASKPSADAVEFAARHASRTGARLTLVHVVTPVDTPPGLPLDFAADLTSSLKQEGQKLLERTAERVRAMGVPVDTALELGDPARRIAELARGEDVEMAVVGSHGKNVIERVLLGSVATKLVHICTKPVLVVR